MSVMKQCERCGEGYSVFPCEAARSRYCSRVCRTFKVQLNCERCGTVYTVPRAQVTRSRYCSRACMWPYTAKTCEHCGRDFQISPCESAKSKFCSVACADAAKVVRVGVVCEMCGATFQRVPSRGREAKYCSRACRNNHMSGDGSPCWKGGATAFRQRRRALKVGNGCEVFGVESVIARDGRACYICDLWIEQDKDITLDHVIPLTRGGPHTLHNVRIACRRCNSRKHNKLLSEFVCFLRGEFALLKPTLGV